MKSYKENISKWNELNKWLWELNEKYAGQIRHKVYEDSNLARIDICVFWNEWGGEIKLLLEKTIHLTTKCEEDFEEIETKINETIDKLISL